MIAAQLQTALIEAKESVDRIYRQEALEYFKLLSDYVKKNAENIHYRRTRHETYGGYLLTPQHLRTHLSYPDLYVVLAYQGQMAGLGTKGDKKVIVLPVLLNPFDTKYLASRIQGVKKIFVHEFIHYLDQYRYKGKPPESAKVLHRKGYDAYYNTPAEFNAYYQEGAGEVLDTLRSIKTHAEPVKPGTLAPFISSFSVFEKRFGKHPYFNDDFVKSLNQKYRRKFMQRLADLYQEIRKEMG